LFNLHEIENKINDVDTLQIFTTDLNGRPVTLQVHAGDLEAFFKKGVGFDGSSVPGYGTVDDSDKLLIPLPETFRNVGFSQEKLGFLIGKIDEEYGERSPLDPRALLEKVVKQGEDEFGLLFLTAPEHEFFLLTKDEFSKDIHTDNAGYFHADPRDKGEAVRKEIVAVLKDAAFSLKKCITRSPHLNTKSTSVRSIHSRQQIEPFFFPTSQNE